MSAVQESLTHTQGQLVQLQCTVTGDPFPVVTWYHDGTAVIPNANIGLNTNSTVLTFNPVMKTNEGVYTCAATNALGSDNTTITLTVIGKHKCTLSTYNIS